MLQLSTLTGLVAKNSHVIQQNMSYRKLEITSEDMSESNFNCPVSALQCYVAPHLYRYRTFTISRLASFVRYCRIAV